MKKTALPLLVLFSIALMGHLEGQAQDVEQTPRVTTQGVAIVYASPDEAVFNFSIIKMNDAIDQAMAENKKTSATVIDYLKSAGVSDRHIQTQHMRVGDRYRQSKDGKGEFQATQAINVCIKDLSKYEEIMAGLLSRGVSNLNGPTFRTTELRKHKDLARRKAVVAAREKAELLAQELGQGIGKAIIINELASSHFGMNQNAYANTIMDQGGGVESEEVGFAPGQLEIKATVQVSFVLN